MKGKGEGEKKNECLSGPIRWQRDDRDRGGSKGVLSWQDSQSDGGPLQSPIGWTFKYSSDGTQVYQSMHN